MECEDSTVGNFELPEQRDLFARCFLEKVRYSQIHWQNVENNGNSYIFFSRLGYRSAPSTWWYKPCRQLRRTMWRCRIRRWMDHALPVFLSFTSWRPERFGSRWTLEKEILRRRSWWNLQTSEREKDFRVRTCVCVALHVDILERFLQARISGTWS